MNYYNEIREYIINNEITKKVKDYSKNKSDLTTYYNVGKLLVEAGKHYGEGIIKKYSKKLKADVGKRYTDRTLRRFRQFYNLYVEAKWSTLSTKLSWSHFSKLLSIKNIDKINYYIKLVKEQNLSIRELRTKIHNKNILFMGDTTKIS